MSINNVLSLGAQSFKSLIQLDPQIVLEGIKIKNMTVYEFLDKNLDAFDELAHSNACSLREKVKAIQFLTAIRAHTFDDLCRVHVYGCEIEFITTSLEKTRKEDREEIFQYFINSPGNDIQLSSLISIACEYGLSESLSLLLKLLEKAKGPHAQNQRTITTHLNQAIKHDHLSCIKMLIQEVSENIIRLGRYPLAEAAKRGHLEVVQLLIEKGANPLRFAHEGFMKYCALTIAMHEGHKEIVSYLLEKVEPTLDQQREIYCNLVNLTNNDVSSEKLDEKRMQKNLPFLQTAIKFFSEHPDQLSKITPQQLVKFRNCYQFYHLADSPEAIDFHFIGSDFSKEEGGLPSAYFLFNSSIFRQMVTSGMQESDPNHRTFPTTLSKKALEAFKEFIRSPEKINLELAPACELVSFSDFWKLELLKNVCENHLIQLCNESEIENIEELYSFAKSYQLHKLSLLCLFTIANKNEWILTGRGYKGFADALNYDLTPPSVEELDMHIGNYETFTLACSKNGWELSISNNEEALLNNPSLYTPTGRLSLYHFFSSSSPEEVMLSFLFTYFDTQSIQIGPEDKSLFLSLQASNALGFKLSGRSFSSEIKRPFALYIIQKVVQEQKRVDSKVLDALTFFAQGVLSEQEIKEAVRVALMQKNEALSLK